MAVLHVHECLRRIEVVLDVVQGIPSREPVGGEFLARRSRQSEQAQRVPIWQLASDRLCSLRPAILESSAPSAFYVVYGNQNAIAHFCRGDVALRRPRDHLLSALRRRRRSQPIMGPVPWPNMPILAPCGENSQSDSAQALCSPRFLLRDRGNKSRSLGDNHMHENPPGQQDPLQS